MELSPLNAASAYQDAETPLPELPPSPVDPSQKWLALAAGALSPTKTGHFGESLSNALGGYSGQASKDAELYARYVPLLYDARLKRAQAKQMMAKQQQEQLKGWGDAMMGGMASLLDRPVVTSQDTMQAAQAMVQQGRVPAKFAEQFLSTLPQDPTELTSYIRRAAIASQDPFRYIAKPTLQTVKKDEQVYELGPDGRPVSGKPVLEGVPERSSLAQLMAERDKLPPNDPRRAQYDDAIRKASTHQPPIASVVVNPEKTLVTSFMDQFGKSINDAQQAALSAGSQIGTIHRLKDALASGKVMAGPGTKFALVAAQIGSTMGMTGRNTEEVIVNTRQAVQSAAQLELDAAGQMRGQGSITDSERKLLQRTSTNPDDMTVAELAAVAEILERRARGRIKLYNQQSKRVYGLKNKDGSQVFGNMPEELFQVEEPSPYGAHEVLQFDKDGKPLTK